MPEDHIKLSRKQQLQVEREEKIQARQKERNRQKLIIGSMIGFGLFIVAISIFFIIKEVTKPLPGTAVKELGRDHVLDIADIAYTSKPPTSGPHFAIWAKRGVYTELISDGYLIHSLEHGYIIISYNCGTLSNDANYHPLHKGDPLSKLPIVPQDQMAPFTSSNPPAKIVALPKEFSSDSCKTMVHDLSSFLNDYQRIIIVPRPDLDAKIVLTAWGRIEKFNSIDKEKMNQFIAALHNKGPEATVE